MEHGVSTLPTFLYFFSVSIYGHQHLHPINQSHEIVCVCDFFFIRTNSPNSVYWCLQSNMIYNLILKKHCVLHLIDCVCVCIGCLTLFQCVERFIHLFFLSLTLHSPVARMNLNCRLLANWSCWKLIWNVLRSAPSKANRKLHAHALPFIYFLFVSFLLQNDQSPTLSLILSSFFSSAFTLNSRCFLFLTRLRLTCS